MDTKYIITPSGSFISTDELYHWGIKGMKWGVRRYQNSDGTLTAAGRKRYTNPDGTLNKKGKKKFGNSVKTAESAESKSKSSGDSSANRTSEMTDAELQNRVNRLRNEDAYRDLSKKLGYDSPKTELDIKIAEMEKQKRYLELQRDIKNLTPENVSRGKKMMNTLMNKVVEPAVTEAGKKLLSQYLTEAGAKALKKETDAIDKSVNKSKKKVEAKQAKQEAKEAKKEAEKQAKQEAKAAKKEAEKSKETRTEKDYGEESVNESAAKASNKRNSEAYQKASDYLSKNKTFKQRVSSMQSSYDLKNDDVDTLLAKIDENGWWTYEREYGGK